LFTVCENGALVLPLQVMPPLVAPLYVATILCAVADAVRVEVVQVAWPEEFSGTFEQPVIATPSLVKLTVPFAPGPVGDAVTVAVKVTLAPYVLGLRLLVTVVVVERTFEIVKVLPAPGVSTLPTVSVACDCTV
jgi:hypothetical protein